MSWERELGVGGAAHDVGDHAGHTREVTGSSCPPQAGRRHNEQISKPHFASKSMIIPVLIRRSCPADTGRAEPCSTRGIIPAARAGARRRDGLVTRP